MKTLLFIGVAIGTAAGCSSTDQPQCSDPLVQSTLKELCAEQINRDTTEITISAVRTLTKNEDNNSCECAATVEAEGKVIYGGLSYLLPVNEEVTYTAQVTDDGEQITVKIQ